MSRCPASFPWQPVSNLSVAGYIGERVKKLSAFQTMSKDGQFLDGTLFDLCVAVVSSHISEHDIQKSDVANFQSGQNVSKYVCEGTHVVPFYSLPITA